MMRRLLVLVLFLFSCSVWSQLNMSQLQSGYLENFDSTSSSAVSWGQPPAIALPTPLGHVRWQTGLLPATYAGSLGGAVNPGLYSFGSNAADVALGSQAGSSTAIDMGFSVFNDLAFTVTSVDISFNVEQWSTAGLPLFFPFPLDKLEFYYLITAAPVTSFECTLWNFILEQFEMVQGPVGGTLPLDGNVNSVSVATSLAVTVPPNSYLNLCWRDFLLGGVNDTNMAIDDVTLQIEGLPLALNNSVLRAQVHNKTVKLSWDVELGSESILHLERKAATDQNFKELKELSSSATSFEDNHQLSSRTTYFYRLQEVTGEGEQRTLATTEVFYQGRDDFSFELYPNPLQAGEAPHFNWEGVDDSNSMVNLVVTTIEGKNVLQQVLPLKDIEQKLSRHLSLSRGLYFIQLSYHGQTQTQRLIVD